MRRRALVVLMIGAVLLLTACAAGANDVAGTAPAGGEPAGFLLGLWHGFIVLFTLVISLFSDSVGIYAVHNTGAGYDIGFVIGVMLFFGGGGGGAARGRR